MQELAAENPIPGAQLVFAHIGGPLNELAADDGAVGNRHVRYVYGAAGMWPPDDPEGERHRWVREAWERFREYSAGGNYVNFQTADESHERVRA